ncbi:MAG TPA: single-stranded-DNA-specific exonuclease RecJ [Anaerolineales bacterium]
MQTILKRWVVAPRLLPEAGFGLDDYHPILKQILYNREITTPQAALRFLNADPPEESHPSAMRGIPEAVERICRAIERQEFIAVYGDYDADGVTATALLTQALQALGAHVTGYIPNRFDEGYGLNNEALDSLKASGVSLVITVDCGIRSHQEAEHSRRIGLDLIISDHHHCAAEIPDALAVINPKQPGCNYIEKNLAGVGLAYKLACALLEQAGQDKTVNLRPADLLDLVALGTVADLAPLTGENRSLVRAGIEAIRVTRRQGLVSLMGAAGLDQAKVNAGDIGFVLGPRLNAAGRLESALASLELLTTDNILVSGTLAQKLDIQNRKRQEITQDIQERAEQIALADNPDALLLFAADPDFNPGVVGLAASRLTEQYYRPAIVAQRGEEFTRASCRSIPEFHITAALDQCAGLLEHHGGHAAAAGFTVRNQNLPILIEQLQAIAQEKLGQADLRPTLKADVDIPLSDLKADLLPILKWLQPTGYGNPQAVFVSRDLKIINSRGVGRDASHLKLTVTDGRITYDAIAFRQGHWLGQLPPRIDLMYTFEVNEFNGRTTLQLNVRDLKPAGTPD